MKKRKALLVSHGRAWAACLLVSLSLVALLGFPSESEAQVARNCWVADIGGNKVVKLGAGGYQICEFTSTDNPNMLGPVSLAVNPADGCCCVACTYTNSVFKLKDDCTLDFWRKYGEVNPSSPCIDEDGNCWILFAHTKRIVKLKQNGDIDFGCPILGLEGEENPIAMAIDTVRQKFWVLEAGDYPFFDDHAYIERFSYTATTCGSDNIKLDGFIASLASGLDVDPTNGYCWVADIGNDSVARISPDGSEVKKFAIGLNPANEVMCVSVDPNTHCCWVTDEMNNRVVKLYFNGTIADETTSDLQLNQPLAVQADSTFGTCWVSDYGNNRVVTLQSDCTYMMEAGGFTTPLGLALAGPVSVDISLTTDKSVYCRGEPVEITINATNNSNESVALTFPTSQHADFEIDRSGSRVYLWSAHQAFFPVFTTVEIPAGSTVELLRETWNQVNDDNYSVPPGIYDIDGWMVGGLGHSEIHAPPKPIEIKECKVQITDVGSGLHAFSFVIITDNHIHAGGVGLDQLVTVVNWINDHINAGNTQKIRFVMHLGDVSDETMGDEGRYSCTSAPLLKVKKVLDQLQVPYVIFPGDHDVWYDNNAGATPPDPDQDWFEKRPEEIFNQVFSSEYDYLRNCILPNWDKAGTPVWNDGIQVHDWSYFQNFAFDYMRYHFICLDWNSRDQIFTSDELDRFPPTRGWPELHEDVAGGTWEWFTTHLEDYDNKLNENILLFAEHPLSPLATQYPDCNTTNCCCTLLTFGQEKYDQIVGEVTQYRGSVDKWFAGEWHYCDRKIPPPLGLCCPLFIPCEEDVSDGASNFVLKNIVTKSVSPFPVPPGENLRLVRVLDDLNVDFTYTPAKPTINQSVSFINRSIGAANPSWDWDFGDGIGSSTSLNPSYTYTKPGVYKVTLTVTDNVSQEKASYANYVDVGTTLDDGALPSEFSDATAYNNARRLIYDNGVLHLIYRWDICDGEACLTYAKSTHNGDSWFEVTNTTLGGGTYPDGPFMGLYPAMAVDESGKPHIAKVRNFGSADMFDAARREKPLGWFSYDRMSESGSFGHPSIVVDPDDSLHIAISYNDGSVSEIRYYRAIPGGIVCDTECVAEGPLNACSFASIALDAANKQHVIWQQEDKIYHSYRTGPDTWSPADPISSASATTVSTPSLVADGGDLYAVWQEDDEVIYKSYNGTQWSDPEVPSGSSPLTGANAYPQVVNSECVVWQDLNGSTYDIWYSKRGGGWSTPDNISGSSTTNSRYPQAAMVNNTLHVVWTEETSSYEIRHKAVRVSKMGVIVPDPMYAFYMYAIDPMTAKAYLGNFADGHLPSDIVDSSVRVNETIVPDSLSILPSYPGFEGEVMEMVFPIFEFLDGYGILWDTTQITYTISGEFSDATPFSVDGDVTLIGHKSGDVNVDGEVNIVDLTYLVDFLFLGGPAPKVPETADVDGNCLTNVADLTYLVDYLFRGGPAPTHCPQ